jgi:integrase
MQSKFYLRTDKMTKDGLYPIRMDISFNSIRIRQQVPDVKVNEKHWRVKEQRIKAPLKTEVYNNHVEFNKKLDDLENKVKDIFRYKYTNDLKPTKELIVSKMNGEVINHTQSFFDSFDEYLEISKSSKATNTIKNYTTCKNFLKTYEEFSGIKLHYEMIDYHFYEGFRDYCFGEKDTVNNYFGKLVSTLKTFMDWSFNRNYTTNIQYKKFEAVQDNIDIICLTVEELLHLFNYNFKSDRLNKIKDVYCFGCFTGYRFSDIFDLKTSNIFENYIKKTLVKTKTIDHITPLTMYSKKIILKYKDTINEPLPVISSQKFNDYIKECCEIAEIDTPTTITRYIGKRKVEKTVPKHKLITSHTARKTFITTSLVLGMSEVAVKKISNHKKDEHFRKYVNVAQSYLNEEMDKGWGKLEIKK